MPRIRAGECISTKEIVMMGMSTGYQAPIAGLVTRLQSDGK
jgi:hypothetical protein